MEELIVSRTVKKIMVKDLNNLYKLDDKFSGLITNEFRRVFTKTISLIIYDTIINNKRVKILNREDSVVFDLQRIEYNDLLKLRKINHYSDIDIVMYNFGFKLVCSYKYQNTKYDMDILSKPIERNIVKRINNGDSLYPKETIDCSSYLDRLEYIYDYKISKEKLKSYINIMNYVLTFLLREQLLCRFKITHFNLDSYVLFNRNRDIDYFVPKKKTIEKKVKMLYKDTEKDKTDLFFFTISNLQYDMYNKNEILDLPNTKSLYLYRYFEEAFFSRFKGYIYAIRYKTNNKKQRFSTCLDSTKTAQLLFCKTNTNYNLPKKITIL